MKDRAQEKQCEFNNFKRARYFHGMLLSDRDFRDEQSYHREKRKLANKMLHGWGIVCGLGLEWEEGKKWITVTPGMALDCHGNEIVVCDPVKLDLETLLCPPRTAALPEDPCREVTAEGKTYYLTIGYEERMIDPVSVYAPGGGCEEKTCEHSRWQEGFCLQLESNMPASPQVRHIDPSLYERLKKCKPEDVNCHKNKVTEFSANRDPGDASTKNNGDFCFVPPPCPACCPEVHHLVLGTVTIAESAGKKTIEKITLADRQYVLTPGMLQYLFVSLFGGAPNFQAVFLGLEEFFKTAKRANENADIKTLLTNPIAALCKIGEQYGKADEETGNKGAGGRQTLQTAVEVAAVPGSEVESAAAEVPNGDKAKKAKGGKK